jgi:hypothetical protein
MIFVAILTDKRPDEVEAISRAIGEKVSRFVEDYPDRANTLVEPWLEPREVYIQQALSRVGVTPTIKERLDRCKSVLYFEGPGNPQECPDQVSVLKLYLEPLQGSVIDWGDIDYGWPLIQLSEDALSSLRQLPDEPRLFSEEPE